MNISVDSLVDVLEKIARTLYKWITTEDEILGEIIYRLHMFGGLTVITLIIVSHTIYPVFWFQFAIFCFMFAMWVQHILLHTCVITHLESRLLKSTKRDMLVDALLQKFGIPIKPEIQTAFMLVVSTSCVAFLGLELLARISMHLRSLLGASNWI